MESVEISAYSVSIILINITRSAIEEGSSSLLIAHLSLIPDSRVPENPPEHPPPELPLFSAYHPARVWISRHAFS